MLREIRNQYREETGKDCKTRQMAGLGFANDYVQWLESKAENLPISDVRGSLPFDEYHKFHKWMEGEGWYEAAEMEYDNHNDPNSCIRLDIKELYIEYKRSNDRV